MNGTDRIYEELKTAICEVMADLDPGLVNRSESLRNLGTNSVDRAMILMQTMEGLGVRLPMIEFAQAQNIEDIISIFEQAAEKA